MPGLKFRRKQEKTLTGYEKMLAGAEQFKNNVGPLVGEGAREARYRASAALHDANSRASRALNEQRVRAEAKYHELDDRYRPEVYRVRDQVIDAYLPRAQKTWHAGNHALTAAITAAAQAGRSEWDKAYPAVRSAAMTPTKQAKKTHRVRNALLITTVLGVAAAAGYAVYRQSRPVEDPWAPPADFSKTHYPTATDTDSSVVEDSVGGGDSGDVAASLGGAASSGAASGGAAAGAAATASSPKDSTLSAEPGSGKRAAGKPSDASATDAQKIVDGEKAPDSSLPDSGVVVDSESTGDKTEGGSHRGDRKD